MSDYIHSVISIEPLEAKNTICDIISCINDKDNIGGTSIMIALEYKK